MADIIDKGIDRLAYQYSDSPNFKGFITGFLKEFEELDVSRLQLLNDRWLNTAQGVNLDVIGEIVGVSRPSSSLALVGFFGFADNPNALSFGSTTDPSYGGRWYDGSTGTTILADDATYLFDIRAKIILNFTAMTAPESIKLISFMVGGARVRYYLAGPLEPAYEIYKTITPTEQEAIENLPTVLGIGPATYNFLSEEAFGFNEDPDAFGFGSLYNPSVGGHFATIT